MSIGIPLERMNVLVDKSKLLVHERLFFKMLNLIHRKYKFLKELHFASNKALNIFSKNFYYL